jgi:hypothetical protein
MAFQRLDGKRFGRLRVVSYHGKNKHNVATWFCECDCGGTKVVPSGSLVAGFTRSCGCYGKENPSHTKHGGKGTRLYHIWKSMNGRCKTPTNASYSNYGGRGISVCDDWSHDFVSFRKWAYGHGYSDDLTIDRIDNDGNYCPENCRWVDMTVQANNTRKNHIVMINGQNKTISNWARHYKKPYKWVAGMVYRGKFVEWACKKVDL